MRLNHLSFLTLILLTFSSYSQSYDDIKDQEIHIEGLSDYGMEQVVSNVYTFIGSDFDSLDLQILLNGPIFGSIIIDLATKEQSQTYADLYQKFLEIKEMPQYSQLRKRQLTANDLMNRPADISNWEEDKPLFVELGLEGDMLEELRLYIENNSSSTLSYMSVLEDYRQELDNQKREERKAKQAEFEQLFDSSLLNETELLARSKVEKKPILLYFTGYSCVNCRKIEQNVLSDLDVLEILLESFIFKSVYVDDRTELPEKYQVEVQIREQRTEKLKTIGDKHMYYQISRFNVAAQPHFVVLNSENEIIETADYSYNSAEKFLSFLESALDQTAKSGTDND